MIVSVLEAHKNFARADAAWSHELHRLFDRRAGDVRYTDAGKGDDGSELRRLHDARMAAQQAWYDAMDAARGR